MPAEYAGPTVVVVGPPDLVITSLVTALRAKGMRAERGRTSDPRALHAHLTHGPAGILLVDLDPHRATNLIAGAVHLGWTVLAVGGGASRSRVAAAVAAGAAGWLPKTTPLRDLVRAVQDLAAGQPVMDEER